MRRQSSANTVGVNVEEESSKPSPLVEAISTPRNQALENGEVFDDDFENDGIPVRKGTMSKDLPMDTVQYTMAGVMAKANQLGIMLLLTPPILFYAHYTGNLHLLSGIVACISAVASVMLMIYKIVNRRKEKESGVVMMGFALYLTAPLCGLSAAAYYLNL